MTTVAVTGACGTVGHALMQRLSHDPAIHRVIGVDVLEPPFRPPGVTFHRLDIRDPDLAKAIVGADVVVHLAFLFSGGPESTLRAINLGGLRNALQAMGQVGATHLVFPSSAFVYGARPNNPPLLDEDSPIAPNAGSGFAEHKASCEQEIGEWHRDHPEATVTILRLAPVFGPRADTPYSRLLESPFLLRASEGASRLCVVHEEDAASAIHFAISERLSGAYNVAADDPLAHDDAVALAGKREIRVPLSVLRGLVAVLHRVGLLDSPPAELDYYVYPWAVSNARLHALGWVPEYSAREAVSETITAHADYWTIGTMRATRDQWRRSLLTVGASTAFATTLATAAAVAILRRGRRHTR